MPTGSVSKFNILQQSPHDGNPEPHTEDPDNESRTPAKWVASRYTLRSSTSTGGMVLWNTFTGRLSAFQPHLSSRLVEILNNRRGTTESEDELVGFLVQRGFLVKKGTDELRRFRYEFGRQHHVENRLQIFLLASEDCNFRCTYCYEDFARGTMLPSVRAGVKNYLTGAASRLNHLTVEWFGGEPLYGFEAIAEIAPFAQRLAEQHSIRYLSKMTTNGLLLTPDVFEELLRWRILSYQITLDGPPEHHDRSRPARDGSPTFDRILTNLRSMKQRSDEFGVMLRVNYDRDNAGSLPDFLRSLREDLAGDSRFRLSFRAVGKWGGARDQDLNVCGGDESMDLQLLLQDEARRLGLRLAGTIHHTGGLGAQVCYAARPYSFIIGATGKVMKCTIDLDRRDRNIVGFLDASGRLSLDADKMALWTEPAFESDMKCQKCVILPSCQGMSCPTERWDNNASPCPSVRTTFKSEMRRACGD